MNSLPHLLRAWPKAALQALFALWTFPFAEVHAQKTQTGVVTATIETAEKMPVSGATVRLTMTQAHQQLLAESDDVGRIRFVAVPPGQGWLSVRRIGFRPESVLVVVGATGSEPLSLVLTRSFVELSPVRIMGRRDITGPMAGFFQRMEVNGGGHFLTRQDLERRSVSHMTDIFRLIPGARIETRNGISRVRMRNSLCAPVVWLDGFPMLAAEVDLDSFDPQSFEGIEIYGGPATVPVEFQSNRGMSSACGVIVLWSKRGELRPKKQKKGEPTPAALVVTMLDKGQAFLASAVDIVARPDSSSLVKPLYPDSLFYDLVSGTVVAEFVVDTNGRAMMNTFSAVTASHRQFIEPVRRAVQVQEFQPASLRGKSVPQLLQLPFHFIPDSTTRRRH